MTADDDHRGLSRPRAAGSADLAALAGHPSLAPLRGRGWLLDGLPATSTVWAFLAALITCFVAYGSTGAAVVLIWTAFVVTLTGSALITRDLRRARITLQVGCYGLWAILGGVLLLVATVSGGPSMNGPAASSPASSSTVVAPAPVSSFGSQGTAITAP